MGYAYGSYIVQLICWGLLIVQYERPFTRGIETVWVLQRGELGRRRTVSARFVDEVEEEVAPGEEHGPAEEEDEDFDSHELCMMSVILDARGRDEKSLTEASIKLVKTEACGTVKSLTYFRHSSLSCPRDSVWQIIHTFTGRMLCGSLNTFPSFES
jgi:hypothetical protein